MFKLAVVRPLASRPIRSFMDSILGWRVPVFMIHRCAKPDLGIGGHELTFIREAIRLVRRLGLEPIPLIDLVRSRGSMKSTHRNKIAFTIDDGFFDQGEIARVFVSESCPVTIFVLTDLLNGIDWPWDYKLQWIFRNTTSRPEKIHILGEAIHPELEVVRDHIKTIVGYDTNELVEKVSIQLCKQIPKSPPQEYRPLDWNQARKLEELGVDFGPHSMSHRIISKLDDRQAKSEIEGSWNQIKSELKEPVPIFAWPTGREDDFGLREINIARDLGLIAAMSTCDDYANLAGDHFSLRRFSLPTDLDVIRQYSTWIERANQLLRH